MEINYEQAMFWLWVATVGGTFLGTTLFVLIRKLQGKPVAAPELIKLFQNHNRLIMLWFWRALEDGVITNEEAMEFKTIVTQGFQDILSFILTTYGKPELKETNDKVVIPEPPSAEEIRNELPPPEPK